MILLAGENHVTSCSYSFKIIVYVRLLDVKSERLEAAREWCLWEMSTSKLIPDTKYTDKADDLEFAAAFSRIECHYFINQIFVEEGFILKKAQTLKDIPTFIVQARVVLKLFAVREISSIT